MKFYYYPVPFVLLLFTFLSAAAADDAPLRWDDFVTTGSNAVLEQRLVTPISRHSSDFTEVRSKQTSYTIGINEVLYIPVWNETPEGAQIGMGWRVENRAPNVVSSVMVEDFHPTHRSNQLSPNFRNSNFGPYFRNPAVPQVGCEIRHGISGNNIVLDNIVLSPVPTAFICIQGRSVGETVLIVGERASTINRQEYYGLTSTGPNVSIDSSYVNPNLSLEISIRVVTEATSDPALLAHAAMEFGFGRFFVRPINSSFELLPCKDLRVFVEEGTSLSLEPFGTEKCIFTYSQLRAPDSQFPPFFDNANINVLVEQDNAVTSGGARTKITRTATAYAHVVPIVDTGSNLTAWAMLSCPTVVHRGARFGCEMRLADTTGSNASDYNSEIDAATLPTNGPYTYEGRPPTKPFVVCFEVEATAENLSSFAITGVTALGYRFRSQQIWIDNRSEQMITVPYSNDCQGAQLP